MLICSVVEVHVLGSSSLEVKLKVRVCQLSCVDPTVGTGSTCKQIYTSIRICL